MKQLKAGNKVHIAPAGVDRNATGETMKMTGRLCQVSLSTGAPTTGFQPTGLVRLWVQYPTHSAK